MKIFDEKKIKKIFDEKKITISFLLCNIFAALSLTLRDFISSKQDMRERESGISLIMHAILRERERERERERDRER